jgi:hypothetical protein
MNIVACSSFLHDELSFLRKLTSDFKVVCKVQSMTMFQVLVPWDVICKITLLRERLYFKITLVITSLQDSETYTGIEHTEKTQLKFYNIMDIPILMKNSAINIEFKLLLC